MKFKTLVLLSLLITACTEQSSKIDLAGIWQITTDSTEWKNTIQLPGSMTSNNLGEDISLSTDWTGGIVDSSYYHNERYRKYRQKGNIKVPFWLQPLKYYKGAAWYKREIVIPKSWEKKDISLFLERCHWETRLWIDNKEVGMRNSLATPHQYDLTNFLCAGKHIIMLRIDNSIRRIDPGINSHSITDHTQGNWNGVVGDMYLVVNPLVNIASVEIYTDTSKKEVIIKSILKNQKDKEVTTILKLNIANQTIVQRLQLKPGENEVKSRMTLDGDLKLWDEFQPNLYTLTMSLNEKTDKSKTEGNHLESTYTEHFGFREFKSLDGKLTINGRRIFLRGTLECAAYPKTGYPPTDIASWRKEFQACINHGLNHLRFHSWCPPEAAFAAADEMGLYLEVESSSWANQSTTIGDGLPIDKYILEESKNIIQTYGNHPSFCMMMYGNEPAGKNQLKYLTNFVSTLKKQDSRRMYSSGGGWPRLPVNDFHSDPTPRIQGWGEGLQSIINAQAPKSDYDWSDYVKEFNKPIISHEIGQWCAYPNFKEIKKYNGIFRPKNLEIFQETLKENGMKQLADSFLLASGKLQTLCYKADIEAALRTKNFGGFQLLGLSDFPGQGTALVGVLDAFWEEKGYTTPKEYKHFCNSTVPLLRLSKFVYTNNESLKGCIEVAHFGANPLNITTTNWTLNTSRGTKVASGQITHDTISIGNCIKLGNIGIPLRAIKKASELVLEVKIGNYTNSWNIWVYPSQIERKTNKENILMVDQLNDTAIETLEKGGKVLLSLKKGSLTEEMGGDIQVGFSSIFWNTAWTHKQPPHTLGLLCNPEHPALREFPTTYHSDYQWWDAMSHSGVIEIAKLSPEIKPIVRVIDDWFTNRPLGLIFEVKVNNGKLLISGVDFWQNMNNRIEAKQLMHSLKSYMTDDAFNPQIEAKLEDIKKLM